MAKQAGVACKACQSARQGEIDARIAKGDPARAIAAWLAEQGEVIAYSAILRHAKNHLTRRAVAKAARKRLEADIVTASRTSAAATPAPDDEPDTPVVEAMVDAMVDKAKGLDAIASDAMSMARFIGREIKRTTRNDAGEETWVGVTLAEANLFTSSLKAATEAIVAREELLGGGKKLKVDVDAKVSGGLAGLFAELEKREAADGGTDKS